MFWKSDKETSDFLKSYFIGQTAFVNYEAPVSSNIWSNGKFNITSYQYSCLRRQDWASDAVSAIVSNLWSAAEFRNVNALVHSTSFSGLAQVKQASGVCSYYFCTKTNTCRFIEKMVWFLPYLIRMRLCSKQPLAMYEGKITQRSSRKK